ncbi:MAG: hypothetical protein K2X46_03070 [Roseomonas sp.]|nr:hypothetical protein [Roseomonas sp.]
MDRTQAANNVDIGGGKRGFRDRNLGTGVRGTTHAAADRNAVQEEIMSVIEAAGLTPDDGDWTQMLAGMRLLFGGGGSVGGSGWQKLPGGLIIQWGTYSSTTGALSNGVAEDAGVVVTFPHTFPGACFGVIATARDVVGGSLQEHAWVTSIGTANFTGGLSCKQASTAMTAFYIALGN